MSAAVCSALLACLVVTAPGADSADTRREAKQYFDAGEALYRVGKYRDAVRALEQAYRLVPAPAIAFSIGQAYRLLYAVAGEPEQLSAAIRMYRRYLLESPEGARRADAYQHLQLLEDRMKRLRAEGTTFVEPRTTGPTQLMVSSAAPGAEAAIDGGPWRTVPVVQDVAPGRHKIAVRAPGHFEELIDKFALEGRLVVAEVSLQRMPALLSLSVTDGAEVILNGRPVGRAPFLAPLSVPEGSYQILVRKNGCHPVRRTVRLRAGERTTVTASTELTTQRLVSYYFLAAGAASMLATGVTVGIALGNEGHARLLLRKVRTEERNWTPRDLELYRDARDRRNDLLTASSVGLVGAALFGGVGLALYVLDDPDEVESEGRFRVTPTFGPSSAGLSGGFRF